MLNTVHKLPEKWPRFLFVYFLLLFNVPAAGFPQPVSAGVPQRIVSLSPAATEILCAVGAEKQLVARTDFCNYPPDVSAIPSVGGFDARTLSVERIIAFRPDLVYASEGMHDQLAAVLRKYGIHVYVSDADSVGSVLAEISAIGEITGHAQEAQAVVSRIRGIFDRIKSALAGTEPVSVYWEVWNSPYMTAGGTSFINELLAAAGGKNIFSDLQQAYPVVSDESIIARNPAVIIVSDTAGQTPRMVASRNGWKQISAVKDRRIAVLNADITTRPGPRIEEAVELIAQVLHPDVCLAGKGSR
jgi:ABC-type Fe3+-hydroxamate transport system substrate-binding protein